MPGSSRSQSISMLLRLVLVLASVIAIVLIAATQVSRSIVDEDLTRNANARALELSGGLAANLNARLLAVDAILENAAAGEGSAGGLLIRRRLLRAAAIRSVVIVPWRTAFDEAGSAPVPLAGSSRRVLGAGQAMLENVSAATGNRSLYLVRALTIAGTAAVVFCEISPDWLWQGIAPARPDASVAVLDNSGQLLQASGAVPSDLMPLLQQEQAQPGAIDEPQAREWVISKSRWRGAVARIQLDGVQLVGNRWMVVTYGAVNEGVAASAALQTHAPAMLMLIVAVIAAAAAYLYLCWQPAMSAVRTGLAGLLEGSYTRLTLRHATDTPRAAVLEFNRAAAVLESRMQAMACLNDIDRLLLDSTDLEQSLDHVLARVCKVASCQGATLALLDPHAPAHARAFVVDASGTQQPVTRIAIDFDALNEIQQQPQGITITRVDPVTHSFLEPLQRLGADFFRVWPVHSADGAAALLAAGYLGVPIVSNEVAQFGTECAARLGVALSNNKRDEELYRQAHFDALTSLPNRLLFSDRLTQELASAQAGLQRGALLYVDLDHFKKVNDSMGHAAGDQLLQIVAQRLRACVKEGDTVARLGGDEFTVVLRSIGSTESARQTAARIIESLKQPVNIGGRDHHVRSSIGVTMFPDDGQTIEVLMRNADIAMYQAKESGRGREVFYNRTMEPSQTGSHENALVRALRRREFLLHYQPQYSLAGGELVGLEALVRWQPPGEALRLPSEFIPAAEESGLIVELGTWVLETACKQMAVWREQGIAPQRMAINVSVQQLRQPDFAESVCRALERLRLPHELLELEITESMFADGDARQCMHRLAAAGVRLSLDDFGTGYSSFGYLRDYPVNAIKIDRSFIKDVATNQTAATLTATMISMAHALGKQVVAEGVERMEQLEYLRGQKCDLAQGYYFARPLSVTDVSGMLQSRVPIAVAQVRASA